MVVAMPIVRGHHSAVTVSLMQLLVKSAMTDFMIRLRWNIRVDPAFMMNAVRIVRELPRIAVTASSMAVRTAILVLL